MSNSILQKKHQHGVELTEVAVNITLQQSTEDKFINIIDRAAFHLVLGKYSKKLIIFMSQWQARTITCS